jgi:hypothetical protein
VNAAAYNQEHREMITNDSSLFSEENKAESEYFEELTREVHIFNVAVATLNLQPLRLNGYLSCVEPQRLEIGPGFH